MVHRARQRIIRLRRRNRRHGGRRHRAGDHGRDDGGAARGRSRLQARSLVRRRWRSGLRPCARRARPCPSGGRRGQARRRRDPRPGVAQRLSAGRAGRPQSVRRIAQASRPLRQYPPGAEPRRLSAALRHRRSISSSCARTPRASTPTAPCSSAPASSCRRPTSRSRCARSRARARRGSRETAFALAAAPPQEGDGGAQGQRAARVGRAVSRMRARGGVALSRRRIRGADHRRDGGAARARRQPPST